MESTELEAIVEFTADYQSIEATSLAELDKAVKKELFKSPDKDGLTWEIHERAWTYSKQDGTPMFVQTMIKLDEEEIEDEEVKA